MADAKYWEGWEVAVMEYGNAKASDNPYTPGTDDFNQWRDGFFSGTMEVVDGEELDRYEEEPLNGDQA
jgi:hypothetical protein